MLNFKNTCLFTGASLLFKVIQCQLIKFLPPDHHRFAWKHISGQRCTYLFIRNFHCLKKSIWIWCMVSHMGNITMKLDICFDICESTCIISKILCSLTHEGLRPGGYTNPYGASGINTPNQTCGATCCGEPCEYVPRT